MVWYGMVLRLPMQAGETANEVLKQIFQAMQPQIVDGVNPDSVMDVLLSEKVIGFNDHYKLGHFPDSRDRCRELLQLLHSSSHPQAFIHLRLALLDEYSWIVDEIDKQLPSLTSQLQQLHLGHSIDGNEIMFSLKLWTIQPPTHTFSYKRTILAVIFHLSLG